VRTWLRYALGTGAVVAALAAVGAYALAQSGGNTQRPLRPGQTKGPSVLVPIFRSSQPGLGLEVADVVRDRLMSDYLITQMYVIPKNDIEGQLTASGYSKSEALGPADLKMLATVVRADEYLDGEVERSDAGLTLRARLILIRPEGMEQPLPPVTGSRPGEVAARLSRLLSDVRKQIPYAQRCMSEMRQGKIDEAIEAAERGIKEYPQGVMPRMCLLEIANSRRWGADSVIKYAEQVLGVDPNNKRALLLVVDHYGAKAQELLSKAASAQDSAAASAMDEKYTATLMKLLALDPTNTQLAATVVRELARTGKTEAARTLVDEAVKQNPGDPALTRLRWDIYRTLRNWKQVIAIGEDMIRTDTAAADTAFWEVLIGAYVADSQPQKAAEAAARAVQKFPRVAKLGVLYAQLARQAGQLPQALEAIERVIAVDPKYPGAYLQKAQIFSELEQVDSMVAALRAAVANGDNREVAAGMAASKVGRLVQEYQRDTAKTVVQGERVLAVVAFADSLHSTETTQFLMGVTELLLGQALLTRAPATKSCEDARRASDILISAQAHVRRGGRAFPQQAQGVMQGAMQLMTAADQQVKAFCR
jgi:tetratricopeptide (TPR) repeat protein